MAVCNLFNPGDYIVVVANDSLEGNYLVGDVDYKFLLGDP